MVDKIGIQGGVLKVVIDGVEFSYPLSDIPGPSGEEDFDSYVYSLTDDEVESLYLKCCRRLFDVILEKNQDILKRLKNNERPVSLEKVCGWLLKNAHSYLFCADGTEDEWYFDDEKMVKDLKSEFSNVQ